MSHRGPSRAALAFTSGFLLAAACSGADAGSDVTRTDSSGVEIVMNHAETRALPWLFTPGVRIGGADTGAASFWDVSGGGVATDTAGRIFVLDRQNFRVAAFDRAGHALWSAGREGKGPGEFSFPWEVRASGDTLRVVDYGGPKVEWLHTSDGRHLGSERMTGFGGNSVPTAFGTVFEFSDVTDEGGMIQKIGFVRDGDTVTVASVAPSGTPQVLEFPDCPISLRVPPMLTPSLVWIASQRHVYATTGVEYVISVFAGDSLVTSIRRNVAPAPTTPEAIDAEYPEGFRVSGGGVTCRMEGSEAAEQLGAAPVVPTIRGLVYAPDGVLWVRRTPTRAERGTFDLFDPDGAYLGTLTDVPVPAAFMPNGDVVGIEVDESDVHRVVVYAVSVGQ
jgi:hypothetical protein